MNRDYQLVSPSLDGVLRHESLSYEGLRRPEEVMQILDGPATKGTHREGRAECAANSRERKILEQYFYDLYGIFMKKLSHYAVSCDTAPDEPLKMMAMLQEMFKVRELMNKTEAEKISKT
jgi:hypothetical protein